MAVGIIFIYLTPGYSPNLMSYLFGSILTVTTADIIALGIMSLILCIYFGAFYRTILYTSFDEPFARTYSAYVDIFKYITTSLVALTIVLNIRMAGVILVLSLLTIPPNIAMLFTRTYSRIILYSILSGFTGTAVGYIISYFAGIPAGATIIFTLVLIWILVKGIIVSVAYFKKERPESLVPSNPRTIEPSNRRTLHPQHEQTQTK
jgi:zinc transport system permease protein